MSTVLMFKLPVKVWVYMHVKQASISLQKDVLILLEQSQRQFPADNELRHRFASYSTVSYGTRLSKSGK